VFVIETDVFRIITHDHCTATTSSLQSYIMSQRFRAYPSQTSLRDRTNLLGETYNTPPASGRSTPLHMHGDDDLAPSGHRFADDLEGQNDERLEGLAAKVKLLKDISIGIGNEVKNSVPDLDTLADTFAESSGVLGGTFRRMNNMSKRQGCRWLWYMVFLIVVFWFFIVVWWWRR